MMLKRCFYVLFSLSSLLVFSQEESIQKIESTAKEIEIATQGLDHIM